MLGQIIPPGPTTAPTTLRRRLDGRVVVDEVAVGGAAVDRSAVKTYWRMASAYDRPGSYAVAEGSASVGPGTAIASLSLLSRRVKTLRTADWR